MEFTDYTDFLEYLKNLTEDLISKDSKEKNRTIRKIVSDSIKFSKDNADSGDVYEAGEILYSAAEILEEIDYTKALELYKENIKLWEKLILDLKKQARLHEIAEIYLRITEIYKEKFEDFKSEKKNIIKSIEYLQQESQLLLEFNEMRKLTQNYQNIAELYLRVDENEKAIEFYDKVIVIAKEFSYYDLLSYSYQQVFSCLEEIEKYEEAKNFLIDGIAYFQEILVELEDLNDNLLISQICQILKNLSEIIDDTEQYKVFSKKEAGAYINLAEGLEKIKENYSKIARYYRGAALCYLDVNENLLEAASCFNLAGNYSEKAEEFNEAALNFFDAGSMFKELNNMAMAYKHFIKTGDNYEKLGDIYQSTENYLNAYDIAIEGKLEFNRYGLFSQIIQGLNKVASKGLKNQEFYTAAALILESLKFYEQLDTSTDILLKEMIHNVYRYYYRAANMKRIADSHVIMSYVYASISCILIGKYEKALKTISEINAEGKTITNYKKMIELLIQWRKEEKTIVKGDFPLNIRRLIESSEDLTYLIDLFRKI